MAKAKFGFGDAAWLAASIAARKQVVRPRDFVARKCHAGWLYLLTPFDLTQVGAGLFVLREHGELDPLVLLARKYPGVTLGLTSALWAHGIIERPPHDWWVIGAKDRRPTLACERARFIRSSWPREDRGEVEVLYEKCFIETHSVARAILDCIRFRRLLGEHTVDAALRAVLKRNDPELAMLDIRAAELHIYGPFRSARRRVLSEEALAPGVAAAEGDRALVHAANATAGVHAAPLAMAESTVLDDGIETATRPATAQPPQSQPPQSQPPQSQPPQSQPPQPQPPQPAQPAVAVRTLSVSRAPEASTGGPGLSTSLPRRRLPFPPGRRQWVTALVVLAWLCTVCLAQCL